MKKSFLFILLLFSLLGFLFNSSPTFSGTIAVETIFSDIETDYKYYDELQTFYDRGMLFPNSEGKFSPYSLLHRDEFVGISMEVACIRCIQPHTNFRLVEEYFNEDIYFDIDPKNDYFYCIAEADDKNFVKGYDPSYSCENASYKTGERPFCPENTITLEESIAVILRNTGTFTIEDNQKVMQKILSGEITEKLSDDVSPKNSDGTPYTFYGYLQKALEFELSEFDTDGNEKVYRMLEVKDGKIRPKKGITREEFLLIAYIAFKSNSCGEITNDNLAISMNILPASCSQGEDCDIRTMNPGDINHDFDSNVGGVCEEGIEEPGGYIWRFYSRETGERFFRYGEYLDNLSMPQSGNWDVYLRVLDRCGNTGEVHSTLSILDFDDDIDEENPNQPGDDDEVDDVGDYITVNIITDTLIGVEDLLVGLEGVITGGTGPYTYDWDFGDGGAGPGSVTEHIYLEPGVYEVTLEVTDSLGRTGEVTVLIEVLVGDSCKKDNDGDGIPDCEDKCPGVSGVVENEGCPILDDSSVVITLDENLKTSCLYNPGESMIYGNAVCNTCPCSNLLDFLADIRKCDIIFPAITSPDAKEIYSKGNSIQIK